MSVRKTAEEFRLECKERLDTGYDLLSEYETAIKKVKVKHNLCGYEYETLPKNFKNGGCPKCANNIRKTTEEFKSEIKDKYGTEYEIIGEYLNNNSNIEVFHNICGTKFNIKPKELLKKKKCSKCYPFLKKTPEQFKIEFDNCSGGEYILLTQYENTDKKVKVKHDICKTEYSILPFIFLRGVRCSYCNGNKKKDTKTFKREVFNLVANEYEVIEEYKNSITPIMIRHKCGHKYSVTPGNFLKGKRCPICSFSKGEDAIKKILDKYSIKWISQYKIANCKNQKCLPFDFAIFNKNNNLLGLIEYDGIQHYEVIDRFGGEKEFIKRCINDEIKNEFCEANKIDLLRIPYWEYENIDKIMTEKLYEKGLLNLSNIIK